MKDLDRTAQSAVREINRRLGQQIRNDFTFPDPAALPDGLPPLVNEDPGIPSSRADAARAGPVPVPVSAKMRERYYGTTDDSSDAEAQMIQETFAFDSPDSVGDEVDEKAAHTRKRKRRDMEQEMRYNTGLCFFQRRRNAWTGAVPTVASQDDAEAQHKTAKLGGSSDSSPVPSVASANGQDSAMDGVELSQPPQTTDTPISEWIPAFHTPTFAPPADPATLTRVSVPVSPPLVPPSNPVRISLASRSHSELYTKIVRDSRTPAIPINLSDMTSIIVQGWKDEGNWPPRGAAPEASLVAPRRSALGANRVSKGVGVRGEDGDFFKHHPHLQRGVEGVKRVFRLSGSAGSRDDEGLLSKRPKSPKSPTVIKGDVGSAFRSHE